jgi:hypothetical protein
MNHLPTRHFVRTRLIVLIGCALLAVRASSWGRLPVPYECEGAIAAIDQSARSLTLVTSPQSKLGRTIKPTRFVWTENTEFIKNGEPTDANLLLVGEHVRVHYQYSTKKHLPILVRVVWGRMNSPR